MHRFFGANRKPQEQHSLQDAINSVDSQIDSVQVKLRKIEAELKQIQDKLSRLPEGPAKKSVKQRAIPLLKQKKIYESRLDTLMQQSMNMEQANITADSMKNSVATVQALKTSIKEIKQQHHKLDTRSIEKLQDEMEEYMEATREINDLFKDDNLEVDEEELDAELSALSQSVEEVGVMPTYLLDEAEEPIFIDTEQDSDVKNNKVAE